VAAWQPSRELELDAPGLRDALTAAVERRERWLQHPCIAALTLAIPGRRWQRDLQLVLWVALHCRLGGRVTVPAPAYALAAGNGEVQAGRRRLELIVAAPAGGDGKPAVELDVWCASLGEPLAGSWAEQPPADEADTAQLEEDIVRYLRACAFLEKHLGACREWLAGTTKVAVPLRAAGDASRSISFPDIPALVGLDLASEVLVLESLVHESAHLNLYLEEAAGPLVDPADEGRFRSPLRSDPRPLRGILMAYHALAFITALYVDAVEATGAEVFERQRASTLALARDAEQTLVAERRRLTQLGDSFFQLTQEVAAYGER
jgi:HEXXH motif-containing protein